MDEIWCERKQNGNIATCVLAWYDQPTGTLRFEAWSETLRGKRTDPTVTLETRPTREDAYRRVMQLADLAFWYAKHGTATETDAGPAEEVQS